MKHVRLRWAGCVAWMEEEAITKLVLTDPILGTRRRDRPKLRWSDGARTVIRVRNWMTAAHNRDGRRKLLKEGRTCELVILYMYNTKLCDIVFRHLMSGQLVTTIYLQST